MVEILYFSVDFIGEDGTEHFNVNRIVCEENEVDYYLNCISEDDLLGIRSL